MKKITKIFAVVLAVALIATSFAACGGTKQAVKVIDIDLTNEQYAFGVDKDQPELLAQINDFIKEIKENGELDKVCNNYFGDGTPVLVESAKFDASKDQLVVATNAEFPPFEYTEGDKFTGIDMEIAALLAKKLNKELVIQHMDFESVCLAVSLKKCDVAMAGLTIQPEREEFVTFSESYYTASQKLVVKGDNTEFDDCKTADDVKAILQSKGSETKVGFQNGTTGSMYAANQGDDFKDNGFKFTATGYSNGVLAVQDIVNGNLTYVVIDAAPANAIVKSINEVA